MSTSKKDSQKTKATSKITFDSLRTWNLRVAVLHAVQGIIILILSATRTFPVTLNYLGVDTLQSQAQNHTVFAAATHQLFSLNLAYLVALFFFIAAIAHILMATKARNLYEDDLKKGVNKLRWFEYALSSGVMLVAIGLLVGVYDLSSLLMIFILCVIMGLLGLGMELYNQGAKTINWLAYIVGCIAGIVPWIVFTIYIIGSHIYGGSVPAFLYWIYATLFIFFVGFTVNTFLQYRKIGRWADYLYGERVYMILSLVAKAFLAWQIFAGSLRP
jgi:hypothetical protein